MFCRKCGVELTEESTVCSNCGFDSSTETVTEVVETVEEPKKEAKVWGIFAKVGFGLGLGGLISSCIPFVCFVGLEVAAAGLVFSILGKKSTEFGGKAKKGIILSAIGLGVGFILTFIIGIFLGLLEYIMLY